MEMYNYDSACSCTPSSGELLTKEDKIRMLKEYTEYLDEEIESVKQAICKI